MISFNHIGIACQSAELEMQFYSRFGYQEVNRFVDGNLKVFGIFMEHSTLPKIELLENFGGHVLDPWLRGGSPMYHIGVNCEYQEFQEFSKLGKVLIHPVRSNAFPGKEIAFVLFEGRKLYEFIFVRSGARESKEAR